MDTTTDTPSAADTIDDAPAGLGETWPQHPYDDEVVHELCDELAALRRRLFDRYVALLCENVAEIAEDGEQIDSLVVDYTYWPEDDDVVVREIRSDQGTRVLGYDANRELWGVWGRSRAWGRALQASAGAGRRVLESTVTNADRSFIEIDVTGRSWRYAGPQDGG